ncbi:MAG: hypothetical protein IPJ31_12690 [Bacteroidetes bacterium]|nr:hypothetical protein [Bacteroidota bacterium]
MKVIYTMAAVQFDLKLRTWEGLLSTQYLTCHFTNLKLAYSNLSGKTIPSYSTVARRINQDKMLTIENAILTINGIKYKVKTLIIRRIEVNAFYSLRKDMDVESLIVGEIKKSNLTQIF